MPDSTSISGLQVLVASARPDLGTALCQVLRSAGMGAALESTGQAASSALAVLGPRVLVLDLDLPGLLLTELRRVLASDTPAVPEPLEVVERRHILTTLRSTGGNRRRAAHVLGIARSTLLAKIRRYQLQGLATGRPSSDRFEGG